MRAKAVIGSGRGGGSRATALQVAKFGIVGVSGYMIDLAVFDLLVAAAGMNRLVAASLAFIAAVANNFFWNRRWTFRANERPIAGQAPRFLLVSCLALAINLIVLELLLGRGISDLLIAQAIATLAAVPFNFLGNKLWAFA